MTSVPGLTVSETGGDVTGPVGPGALAVIAVVPAATPVARPVVGEMLATPGTLEAKVATPARGWVDPSVYVPVARKACVALACSDVEALLLNLQRLKRDIELFMVGAGIGVGPRGLGRDGDANQILRIGGGLRAGLGRFNAAADLAPKINLVGHVQGRIVRP